MTTDALTPLALPSQPGDWPAFVQGYVDEHIGRAEQLRDELRGRAATAPADDTDRDRVLLTWDEIDRELRNASSAAALFANVHPDAEVRELCERASQRVAALATEVQQDTQICAALTAVPRDGLDDDRSRMLDHALRDFRRAAVDRDEETRARVADLSRRIVELSQEFDRRIRDDVRSIRVAPDRLVGLPQDWLDAHRPDDEGLVTVTTDYPDLIPVRTFCQDATTRRELTTVSGQRGWPDNQETLARLVDTRNELARLLGYADWPSYDAEVKMIGSGSAIPEFIDQVSELARERAQADRDQLLARLRQDEPGATGFPAGDILYYEQVLAREQHDVDAQEVRRYFAFDKVRDGVLAVTGRLFGITWVPQPDVPVWHPDVQAYDVVLGDELVGRIYLDLHPRDGKYGHAAMFELQPGATGRALAEGTLVCNFSTGNMEHSQVTTMFHEFGHLVHHVLAGRQRVAGFSGVTTEWDFVEAPSQMLEHWAWDPDVLATFATDDEGRPIPPELVARMHDADTIGRGVHVRRQMWLAALSYWFHAAPADDLDAQRAEIIARYDLLDPTPDTHMHTSFGHLTGYSSGYYTYMWSLVIAEDMFSGFDHDDLMAPEPAARYRDRVLAQGGRRDAKDLVSDLLGRPYGWDAFRSWLA